jgi:hypothetical protein
MEKAETIRTNSDFLKNLKNKLRRKSNNPFERLYKDLKRETDQYLRTVISQNRLKDD